MIMPWEVLSPLQGGALMGLVYFLGAGFSAAYGLPMMNQFFPFARQCPLLDDNQRRFLAEVQRFAHMGVRLVNISRNNMEEMLSFLEMAEQGGQVPDRIRALSRHADNAVPPSEMLKRIIAAVYGPLTIDTAHWQYLARYAAATFALDGSDPAAGLAQVRSGTLIPGPTRSIQPQRMTIITTNYDLCIEVQLLRFNRLRVRLVGNWVSSSGNPQGKGENAEASIYDSESPVTLLRLHGAVNWGIASQIGLDGKLQYDFRVVSHLDPKDRLPWAIKSDLYGAESTTPFLVAPTILKHQADGPYAEQWREAAKALAKARHVIFVGYSFPESDAYMRYFLGASLSENVDLESIIIVDPRADEIVGRLAANRGYGPHFVDMLRPYGRRWDE